MDNVTVQEKLGITNTDITRYRLLRGNFFGPKFPSIQVYAQRYCYSEIGCYEITVITREISWLENKEKVKKLNSL